MPRGVLWHCQPRSFAMSAIKEGGLDGTGSAPIVLTLTNAFLSRHLDGYAMALSRYPYKGGLVVTSPSGKDWTAVVQPAMTPVSIATDGKVRALRMRRGAV